MGGQHGSYALRSHPMAGRHGGGSSNPLPYQQGHLDGLCGLYAAVNAVVLLFSRCAPLTNGECWELFRMGLDMSAPPGELAATVALGVDVKLWRKLVTKLARHAAAARGYDVSVSRLFRGHVTVRLASMHRAIASALDSDAVVLAMLCGRHDHFTVISGHDTSRYHLFDSGGLRWLAKSACGLPQSDARHRSATSVLPALAVRS